MIIADLEIHSRYARACSKDLSPQTLNAWAKLKGVNLLSSGDITHPLWRREMRRALIEKETGFYILHDEKDNPNAPRFVLGGEVSLMFRQGEKKGRRVHVMFLAPSFEAVERLVEKINDKGKLASDGRVILSMSCRDFAAYCYEAGTDFLVIPAHIWTPWFGLLGSKSGFDSIEEAFEDLAPEIRTFETGLSADPAMCWRVESLKSRVLISSSDLHSGPNMMREATLLNGTIADYDYSRLRQALSEVGHSDYWGTLEFHPEEGRYHADGHASCKIVLTPDKTEQLGGRCPACGGPITVGVLHRVYDLAAHPEGHKPLQAGNVIYSVPLQEIIAEAFSKTKQAKVVKDMYSKMTSTIGPEYGILHELTEFPNWLPERILSGIQKVRSGDVVIEPGYDGLYGKVRLFEKQETALTLWD